MIGVEVNNCNNILSASIQLQKNHLNIRYAMNGIGKSTIALAIEYKSKQGDFSALQTFGSKMKPDCKLSGIGNNVLLFNEAYVNNIVFQENEVIPNSFEVFIKTPEYEAKQALINERLKKIRVDVSRNEDLQQIVTVGRYVLSKFSMTISGNLKQTGVMKSLMQSESPFKLPEKLTKFQPLMDDYTVNWVGWKHEGSNYDGNDICPFCTSGLSEEYESEKSLFTSSYTKSNVKNMLDILSHFRSVEQFMEESAKEKLRQCLEGLQNENETKLWVSKFYSELSFLVNGITNLEEFNSYQVRRDDISKLGDQLKRLVIDISALNIFSNKRVHDAVDLVNRSIQAVQAETESLKRDIGELTSFIVGRSKDAVDDINNFLLTAGISYSFEITPESEDVSRTILKYISKTKDLVEVEDIKDHLSWGERNAFALVLFMREALSKKPDLIILDDPISSFDSNKKYAIISRLFSSKRDSFNEKTVLMLTHDMQPLIDFIKIHKPAGTSVSAYFLQNDSGVLSEQEISDADIKSFPKLLAEDSRKEELHIVHRVVSLRKLLEHMPNDDTAQKLACCILSSLLHGRVKPTYTDSKTELSIEEIKLGERLIKEYIANFEYTHYSTSVFTENNLLKSFKDEQNSYIRLQVFRVLVAVLGQRKKIKTEDDPLLKYIDEQFHVENDYIFSLDLMKYDIVPDFVIPKCIEFLENEHLIS